MSGPAGQQKGHGLDLNGVINSVIENITVHNREYGVFSDFGGGNNVFRGNNLTSNGTGMKVNGASVTVTGNMLGDNVTGLFGNVVSNFGLRPDNDFSGSTTAVVLSQCSGVVEGLTLNNATGLVLSACHDMTVRNMDLSGPAGQQKGYGLNLNSVFNSVVENITVHNREYGVFSDWGGGSNVFSGNNLTGNGTGMKVNGASVTVTGNMLGNNVRGLYGNVVSDIVIRANNDFSGSTTAVLLGQCSGLLEGLTLNNPTGLVLSACHDMTVRNMDLSGPAGQQKGYGLNLTSVFNSVIENVTAHNREYGVFSDWGGGSNVFRGNNLAGNGTGLKVNGASVTVTGNMLGNNVIGLFGNVVSNFGLRPDNDYNGSTTAVLLSQCSGVLEGLTLNNPTGLLLSSCHDIMVRNMDLSGPVGGKTGTGLGITYSSNLSVSGVLVANRDTGITMAGTCGGNLLANNTVVNNNTGLLLAYPCSGASIVNSIIWGNSDDLQDQTGLNQVSYSDVQEVLLPGEGNIHADPLFVNAAGGDFRLRAGSPCIDAGINTAAGLPVTDLDGNLRIRDGDDDGNAVIDIGAYEGQAISPIINNILPSSGTVSSIFTIGGSGFGTYFAATSRVFIGTVSASIVSWTSTAIQGTVSDNLVPGIYPVAVERELNGNLVKTSTVSYTVVSVVSVSRDGLVSITTPEVELSINAVSTSTLVSTSTVFSAMSVSGLAPVLGAFYELEPSGIQFTVPAKLTFIFSTVGIDTATVSIYYYDGVSWSSMSIYNQHITFGSDGLATVEGEIYHTSLYALLRVNPVSPVTLNLNPEVLNMKSNGEVITATLHTTNGATGCFKRETINISAVNRQSLTHPIFALAEKGKGYTLDCGSATVKFSREAVIAVLPANAVATIIIAGGFTDGRIFQAEDTIKTINLVRASETGDGFTVSADSSFRLGEAYVYPNPAKGGNVPTFHVEVGIADTVKIRVYTVAGQFTHERILTGGPQIVGSVYAYEYAWTGRIASGVYYYTIEAERSGKKLKARGKFAVVR